MGAQSGRFNEGPSDDLQICCRGATLLRVAHQVVCELLSLGGVADPGPLHGADVNEHILTAVIWLG